jgi:peptide/nickel transport system ATP-binding protein
VTEPLLQVRDLSVEYWDRAGDVEAVDSVSFDIGYGEIFGLAGESGSGKSTIGKALMRVLSPPGIITSGEVLLEGQDILKMNSSDLRNTRWKKISMVFQSALESLNPVLSIYDQIADTLEAHQFDGDKTKRAIQLLELVGIDIDRLYAFPHQLSGGMRQRIGIALALALEPKLLIMDEPTTALDVVVQREILQRIKALQAQLGFSVMFITHDLPLMLSLADRIAVLYAGRLCELAYAKDIRQSASHPYARALMDSFPDLRGRRQPEGISGSPPSLQNPPTGCRFHPRCKQVMQRCRDDRPELIQLTSTHQAACFLNEEVQA